MIVSVYKKKEICVFKSSPLKGADCVEWIKRIGAGIGYTALSIFLLALCIFIVVTSSKEIYEALFPRSEIKEMIVEGKTVYSDLYGNLTYYAAANEEVETVLTINSGNEDLVQVPLDEYETMQNGEVLKRESINSFNVQALGDMDVIVNLLLLLAFSAPLVFGPVVLITMLPVIGGRMEKYLTKIVGGIYKSLLVLGFLLVYISLGLSIANVIQSHAGEQIQTEAIITDNYSDPGYGRYEAAYYYLAFTYKDEQGNPIHMTKLVKPSVYYETGDSIKISHPAGEPYKVHFGDAGSADIFFYLEHLFMYFMTFILTVLFLFTAFLMRRKKKTGSYWKKKEMKKDIS